MGLQVWFDLPLVLVDPDPKQVVADFLIVFVLRNHISDGLRLGGWPHLLGIRNLQESIVSIPLGQVGKEFRRVIRRLLLKAHHHCG